MTTSEKIQRAGCLEELADDLREKADDAPHIFNDMAEQADKETKAAWAEIRRREKLVDLIVADWPLPHRPQCDDIPF